MFCVKLYTNVLNCFLFQIISNYKKYMYLSARYQSCVWLWFFISNLEFPFPRLSPLSYLSLWLWQSKWLLKVSLLIILLMLTHSNALFTCKFIHISWISERRAIPKHNENVELTSTDAYLGKSNNKCHVFRRYHTQWVFQGLREVLG